MELRRLARLPQRFGRLFMDKTDKQKLSKMHQGGKITGNVLQELLSAIRPGVTTKELDAAAEMIVRSAGGTPSFQTVPTYKWTTCITLNEEIVHGVPGGKIVQPGDLISIDVGTMLKGFHTDAAWTVIVPDENGNMVSNPQKQHFLDVGRRALSKAMSRARVGNRVADVSASIQASIEGAGCSVSKEFTGHFIGQQLHEEPSVPGIGKAGTGLRFEAGMTLAIEVIYAMGSSTPVYTTNDGWTVATEDGSLAALFEHTIAVTENGPLILTPHALS